MQTDDEAGAGRSGTSADERRSGEPLVTVRRLEKRFDTAHVLKGVDLDVDRGEVTVVIGPSGSGKSTLLRCINFIEEYDAGEVRVDGKLIGYEEVRGRRVKRPDKALSQQRADVAMVFQRFNLFPHMTALQNVTLGPIKTRGVAARDAEEQARAVLAKVGLSDKVGAYPNRLSGGQQQRVAIARALAMQPKVMLFDEVTSALDPELVDEVLDVMQEIASEGRVGMIIVTHEMHFAQEVADTVVFMDDGRVIEFGPAEKVMTHPETERLQQFLKRFKERSYSQS